MNLSNLFSFFGKKESSSQYLPSASSGEEKPTPMERVASCTDLYQLEKLLKSFKQEPMVYKNFDPIQFEKTIAIVSDAAKTMNEHALINALHTVDEGIITNDIPVLFGIQDKIVDLIRLSKVTS